MARRILSGFAIAFLFGAVAGCAAPLPIEDYTYARTAMDAARKVESGRYASGYWYKAEENYRKGQKAFKEFDSSNAKKYFQLARQYAERAENATRLKKFQSGEVLP